MDAKERTAWALVVLFASTVSYFVGQKSATPRHEEQAHVSVSVEGADVLNEINKSFGWAKAPENIDVEAVDVVKGVRPGGDDYPHPMPAIKLALKNVGDADLESFGVDVSFFDELNKRDIANYGQATGFVGQGWTTEKMLFDARETDWRDVLGTNKIDFPVTMVIYVRASGGAKEIVRMVVDPWEIDILPELSH